MANGRDTVIRLPLSRIVRANKLVNNLACSKISVMKKTFILFALAVVLSVLCSPKAMADSAKIPSQILYWGKKTSATNYAVGTCKKVDGGYWQQLADGTWAPPNDELNTCETGGVMSGYTGNTTYDPWARIGLTSNQTASNYLTPASYYTWGNNYPGGYTNTSDWITNCVLMQSLVARPECQAYPRTGYFWQIDQPWGSYSGEDGIYASVTTTSSGTQTSISAGGSLKNVLMGVLLGYGLNQILN